MPGSVTLAAFRYACLSFYFAGPTFAYFLLFLLVSISQHISDRVFLAGIFNGEDNLNVARRRAVIRRLEKE